MPQPHYMESVNRINPEFPAYIIEETLGDYFLRGRSFAGSGRVGKFRIQHEVTFSSRLAITASLFVPDFDEPSLRV